MRTDVSFRGLLHNRQQYVDFFSGGKFSKMRHTLLHLTLCNFVLLFKTNPGQICYRKDTDLALTFYLCVEITEMKKFVLFAACFLFFAKAEVSFAQCSICTKTASQLGEKTGKGLNTGIIYLMLTPFAVGGFIGYRWWRREKELMKSEE